MIKAACYFVAGFFLALSIFFFPEVVINDLKFGFVLLGAAMLIIYGLIRIQASRKESLKIFIIALLCSNAFTYFFIINNKATEYTFVIAFVIAIIVVAIMTRR